MLDEQIRVLKVQIESMKNDDIVRAEQEMESALKQQTEKVSVSMWNK